VISPGRLRMRRRPESSELAAGDSSAAAGAERIAGGSPTAVALTLQLLVMPSPACSLGAHLPAGPCAIAAPVGIFSLLEGETSLISPIDSMTHTTSCKQSGWFGKPGLWLLEHTGSDSPRPRQSQHPHAQRLSIPHPDASPFPPAA